MLGPAMSRMSKSNSPSLTYYPAVGQLYTLSVLTLEIERRHKFDNDHRIIDEDWNITTLTYHSHDLVKGLAEPYQIKHSMEKVINNY